MVTSSSNAPSVRRLARDLADLKVTVRRLATSPRLSFSSIEGGSIDGYDDDGNPTVNVGELPDGSTGVNPIGGPIPPVPTGFTVRGGIRAIVVEWTGKFVADAMTPLNFGRIEIHASEDPDFECDLVGDAGENSTLKGVIETPRGGGLTIGGFNPSEEDGQPAEVYVRLVTRSTSGKYSAPSALFGPVSPISITKIEMEDFSVTEFDLEDFSISADKLQVGSVTSAAIAAAAVSPGKIGVDAVVTNTIAANAIVTGKINALAVTANEVAANAVTAAKISANAVVAGKIDTNAVVAANILAGAIQTAKIDANAVTALTIATNAVTALKIDTNAVTAGKIDVGAVVAASIATDAITANKLDAGAITAKHTITGATFQTSLPGTGPRVAISPLLGAGAVSFFDASGTLIGLISSGSGAFRIGTTASSVIIDGAQLDMSGHSVNNAYNVSASNQVAGAYFTASAPNTGQGSITGIPNGRYLSGASGGQLCYTSHANSSIRYKKDVETLDIEPWRAYAMEPVSYELKDGPEGERFWGYIAEQLRDLGFDQMLGFDDEGEPSEVDYAKVGAVINQIAIRDLDRRLVEKNAELSTIRDEVAGLRELVEQLAS